MAMALDHLILPVNDRDRSAHFYASILGPADEGISEPFATLRVTAEFVILLAQWGTTGGEHLAFAMSKPEFDAVFARIKAAHIPYGDRFDAVGNNRGPGIETGAQGTGEAVYFSDPDRHLIEIRHYRTAQS